MSDQPHTSMNHPAGMLGFSIVWAGQLVSVLASNMSGFALTIWAFQKTSSATVLGLLTISFMLPFLIISPIAGAMVDRCWLPAPS
jgi:DHA3 family macrolide efflux protein-like MFS transporter